VKREVIMSGDAVVLAEPWYDAPGSDWSLSLFPAGAFLDLLTEEAA
jgi:hypothetical protein